MDYIRAIERQQIREDMPRILVGDNVKRQGALPHQGG